MTHPSKVKSASNSHKTQLELAGTIQAGFPAPGDDSMAKELSIDQLLISNPNSTYLMRVTGLSMKNIGIFEGDLIVVDRSKEARSGDVVIAYVNQGFTLKRLLKRGDKYLLMAENDSMAPIKIDDNQDNSIWGVAVGLVRKL